MKKPTASKFTAAQVLTDLPHGYRGTVLKLSTLLSGAPVVGQRELNQNSVTKIVKSLMNVGKLIEPIIVCESLAGAINYKIVAGRHRLEALRILCDAAYMEPEQVSVPVVLQTYGDSPDEILCTNTSRRFTPYEQLTVKEQNHVLSKSQHYKLEHVRFAKSIMLNQLTHTTLMKMASYCYKNRLDVREFYTNVDELISEGAMPSNTARYWLPIAEAASRRCLISD